MLTSDIKHPKTFDLINGRVSLVDRFEAINQSIRLILTTSRGELWGDPAFGCSLQEYLFSLRGNVLEKEVTKHIAEVLNKQEPRISVKEDEIKIDYPTRDTMSITITYTLRYTDYKQDYQFITYVEDANEY